MRAETPFGQREFFLKSSRPSFLIKRAALGNLKASFHCTHWHRFFPLKKAPPLISVFFNGLYTPFGSPVSGGQKPSLPLKKVFRIPPSPFSQKEVFLKSSRPSLPLKKGSTFLTKPLFPQGREDVTALRCSEPLRSKVGGPKRSSPYFAGWDRLERA